MINNNSRRIIIAENACNSVNQTRLDIQHFFGLSLIEIASNNFKYVNSFVLSSLPKLKEIHIGDYCFEGLSAYNEYKFSITNCTLLSVISIGKESYSRYSDPFEIRACPSLEHIVLQGSNFHLSRLVFEGIFVGIAIM